MNRYQSRTSLPQILATLVATVLIGSVALVGTVGPVTAAPTHSVA